MANLKPIDIYPRSRGTLNWTVFENPPAEYRGTPLWSWNTRLDRDQLFRQIGCFKEMGLGGFHIHPRTGLATEYLGTEFMGHVRAVTEKAKAEGMLSWLYDEDRWPSGFAGGLVTKDPKHRARHLLFTSTHYGGKTERVNISAAHGARMENGVLLARYAVTLDAGGCLASYRTLSDGDQVPAGARVWFAYLETARESAWFNNQTYVDTLSREAIQRFVEVTHEAYKKAVGDHFGKTIPAIFTDEPQFPHKQNFRNADETRDIILPWTTNFLASYEKTYGQKLEAHLPELFWELPGGRVSVARYRYHDHLAERFAAAFADTVGQWCDANGIALTGHMMEEPTLQSQTAALGEAMRSYRSFQLPGIDMLCDWQEYTTAKQAQSAAHQYP